MTEFYEKERLELWHESQKIANRVSHEDKMSDSDKSKYYSDWRYSTVRLSSGLPNLDKKQLQQRLDLTEEKLEQMLNFLIERNLIQYKKGFYSLRPASTNIGKDSPQVIQHHSNWRIKSLDTVNKMTEDELMYTAPRT